MDEYEIYFALLDDDGSEGVHYYRPQSRRPRPSHRYASCRFCHTNKLTWKREHVGWSLRNPDGTRHACREYANMRAMFAFRHFRRD